MKDNLATFFICPFAKLIWRTIQFTFNIVPPANATNMFENWLNGVENGSLCFDVGYLELS
jgi:hypothetical protein